VNTHQLCFISAVSTPLVFNNTALYQKKSSKAPSPAVSQAASSEYVHQELISDFSVRVIVKVLGVYGGRTWTSPKKTFFTSFCTKVITVKVNINLSI
jgi:hypothetical protein